MTAGERAVWAAEFVRHLANTGNGPASAKQAFSAVTILRRSASAWTLSDDERYLVDDMLGVKR